jgi:hypothetical protein
VNKIIKTKKIYKRRYNRTKFKFASIESKSYTKNNKITTVTLTSKCTLYPRMYELVRISILWESCFEGYTANTSAWIFVKILFSSRNLSASVFIRHFESCANVRECVRANPRIAYCRYTDLCGLLHLSYERRIRVFPRMGGSAD